MTDNFGEVPVSNSEMIFDGNETEQEAAPKTSTGPKTPQGKRRSSKNSIRHGFFSKELVNQHMLNKADQKAYSKLLADLCEQWDPTGAAELIQVQLMASHLYQYKCALRLNTALRGVTFDDLTEYAFSDPPKRALDDKTAVEWRSSLPPLEALEKIQRYEAHCLKNYYRALLMLEQLRCTRLNVKALPGTAIDQIHA